MGSNDIDIRTMSPEETWQMFKTEVSMDSLVYKEARFGVVLKFDINDYFMGHIAIKPKSGKVFIRSRCITSESFYTELEMRERLMKKWLLENFGDEEVATPRGIMVEKVQGVRS